MISRFLFSFIFAYRNIMKYKLRSLLFILSFIALLVALMLSLSVKGFVWKYYFHDLEQTYQDVNLIMKTSESANARYFSIRALNDREDPDGYIDSYASFFEIPTLVYIDQNQVYVNMLLGSMTDLNFISRHESISVLSYNEVIITSSFAESHNLIVGDLLSVEILSSTYNYTIKEILLDQGIFKGDAVFMLKDDNLSVILKTLYPSLSNLPSSILANLQNVVYIKYNDDYSFETVQSYIRDLSGYAQLNLNPPYDINQIESTINRSYALVSVVLWIIVLAIFLVMQTTLIVYFTEKKKKIAIIDLLGGRSRFSYAIIFIEFLFFYLISLVLSIYLSNLILSLGTSFVGVNLNYQISDESMLISSISTMLLFLGLSLFYFRKFKKDSSIEGIKESFVFYKDNLLGLFILSSLFIGLYMISNFIFSPNMTAVVKMISFVVVLFSVPFLLIKAWIKVFQNKDSKRVFHLKIMLSAKSFKQYTYMLLISLISIFLLVLTNHHTSRRVDVYSNEIQINYLMTNFTTNYDDTYLSVQALDQVDFVSKATLYEGIYFESLNHSIDLTISIDKNDLSHYFSFDFESVDLTLLDDINQAVIYLPYDFKYLYHLNIGDYVSGSVGSEFSSIEFLIGGFFEKQLNNLAFTNLHQIPDYQNTGHRVLLVVGEDTNLYQTLISQFSPNFIYVINYQSIINNQVIFMQKTIQYLSVVMSIIIICFVLGILNHSILLFEEMKKNYARMHILGLSKIKIQGLIIEEGIIYFLFLLISTVLSFALLSSHLTDFILLFGAYELIDYGFQTVVISSLIVFVLFVLIRLVYAFNIHKLKSSSVLRIYE